MVELMSESDLIIRLNNAPAKARPGLFLDRDGVVVENVHYLRRVEDIRLMPGISGIIELARSFDMSVAVVTNQSGLARGLFNLATYHHVSDAIDAALLSEGRHIDISVACPFHPDKTPESSAGHEWWRKPGPGMIHLVGARYGVDLGRSWIIGDNLSDLEAGARAGLAGGILLGQDPDIFPPWRLQSGFSALACRSLDDAGTTLEDRLGYTG